MLRSLTAFVIPLRRAAALALALLAAPASAQTLYGLAGPNLLTFSAAAPGTVSSTTIGNLPVGQVLVGIDSRPATGELFVLGYNAVTQRVQLHRFNFTTNNLVVAGPAIGLNLGTATDNIGVDFDPVTDLLRVVSTADVNVRLNPDTGALAATGTALAYATGDAHAGLNPQVAPIAYTRSYIGAASTTLYGADRSLGQLVALAAPDAGALASGAVLGPVSGTATDLDFYTNPATRAETGFLLTAGSGGLPATLYSFNPGTGATTSLGSIGGGTQPVTSIAAAIDRTVPALTGPLFYGITGSNQLLTFDASNPMFVRSLTAIAGLGSGQVVVGSDVRPSTGELFAVGYNAAGPTVQLYILNKNTAAATPVGAALALNLGSGTAGIGVDFNPVTDRLRLTTTTNAGYLLNPDDGTSTAVAALAYASGDVAASQTPALGAGAFTNSYLASPGTTFFGIDEVRNSLVRQPNGSGALTTVGSTGLAVVAATALQDLDILFDATAQTNTAYLAANPGGQTYSNFYTLNTATGTPTLVGSIGLGVPVRDIAASIVLPNVPILVQGTLLYGISTQYLVSFDSALPGTLRSVLAYSGIASGQSIVGADFRPATGQLYVLGYNAGTGQGQLYILDTGTGVAAPVGGLHPLNLGTTAAPAHVGFDFNPLQDRIRVVASTTRADYRLSPTDGSVVTDRLLAYASGDSGAGQLPAVGAAAYSGNSTSATVLYDYDEARNALVTQNGTTAALTTVGLSGLSVNAAVDTELDIVYNSLMMANTAYLEAAPAGTANASLYTVDLTTGAATLAGRVGSGVPLRAFSAFRRAEYLVWTGLVSSNWATAANWLPVSLPTAANSILVPRVPNQPTISSGTQFANNVELDSTAVITIANGATLSLSGSVVNFYGNITGVGTGLLRLDGSVPQVLGGTQLDLRNLTVGATGAVLAGPLTLSGVLTLNGDFNTSLLPFTLLSDANGTAMVVNNGSFAVQGRATVQRYITPGNAGLGYRHYSSPVQPTTVTDFVSTGFTPVITNGYNSASSLGLTVPFPNFFGYDETRLATSPALGGTAFDKGWYVPASAATILPAATGYTVNLPAATTVALSGTLNTGPFTASNLSRGTDAAAGYHLLGNPYPSPLDWNALTRTGLDNAVYVFRSTSQYGGQYAAYVNGFGTNGGTNVLAAMQGFFVHTTTAGVAGSLAFGNNARPSAYANPTFQRSTSSPLIRLALTPTTGPADEAVLYADPAATPGFDAAFDAFKMPAATAPGLALVSGGQLLAISAVPAFGAAIFTVPLALTAPLNGPATLAATELVNLPPGTRVYLLDAVRGTRTDLSTTPSYAFTPTAADATRFALQIGASTALATAPLTATDVQLYPNPARNSAALRLPTAATLVLHDALGRPVWQGAAEAGATAIPLTGLRPGVYALQIRSGGSSLTQRLVVE